MRAHWLCLTECSRCSSVRSNRRVEILLNIPATASSLTVLSAKTSRTRLDSRRPGSSRAAVRPRAASAAPLVSMIRPRRDLPSRRHAPLCLPSPPPLRPAKHSPRSGKSRYPAKQPPSRTAAVHARRRRPPPQLTLASGLCSVWLSRSGAATSRTGRGMSSAGWSMLASGPLLCLPRRMKPGSPR